MNYKTLKAGFMTTVPLQSRDKENQNEDSSEFGN